MKIYKCLEVPTETPPSGCLNGGFGLNNGTCICPAHYVGKTCETIECLNGGTIMGSVCGCTAGYTGEFCELGYIILFINGYIVDNTGTVELYEELEKTEIQVSDKTQN
uniref:EGF-like domain-containing protein n=1 Tax=Syphacia muris TaxID=451379 RepID=A0A0N5AFF1_9BILA